MQWRTVGWILGAVWLSLAGVLMLPLCIALFEGEPWLPFAYAGASSLCAGSFLMGLLRASEQKLGHREAFLTVSLVWFSICVLGAIPYVTHPSLQISWIDGLFESVSGFTTTGATVLSELDRLPESLLLWRSLTQWLGGMGIVIFGIAVLPLLGVGGMQLYKAEAPGPSKDRMTPRIAETAKLLWALYLGLTFAAGLLFFLDGMNPFDAVNHAMTAISTGGFSTHDKSLAFYDSGLIHWVTTATMLAGGTSFVVLHRVMTGGASWSDQPELRTYITIFGLATLVITIDLLINMPGDFSRISVALEHSAFQAASILTTTGYATADFDLWPAVSHVIILALICVGGMAGSTAGGPKVIRVMLLAKLAMLQFFRLIHRRAVVLVRLGPQTVEDRVLASSLGFLCMWFILVAFGTLALAADGSDLMSSLSAAAVTLGNIGPGFGAAGPSHTFAAFHTGSKLVMELLMLLGRLEIYTVLIILTPGFWRF